MTAIFSQIDEPGRIRLVNIQTLGAMCGTYDTHEAAERDLRSRGYAECDFGRDANTVWFRGGINC